MYQPYASYFSYAQRHSAAASNSAYMDSFKVGSLKRRDPDFRVPRMLDILPGY